MAQDATGRQHGSHPMSPHRQSAMPDRVDASVYLMEPAGRECPLHPRRAPPELPARDHTMLAFGREDFGRYRRPNRTRSIHARDRGGPTVTALHAFASDRQRELADIAHGRLLEGRDADAQEADRAWWGV